MLKIENLCQYLYNSLNIPIYLYNNDSQIDCYPEQGPETLPPLQYLTELREPDKTISYTMTSFFSYYGHIKISEDNRIIIIGPINSIPYTNDVLKQMSFEFKTKCSDKFISFFMNIPVQNIYIFLNHLLMINYTINHMELTREDIHGYQSYKPDMTIAQKYSQNFFLTKEGEFNILPFEMGNELMHYVEKGNIDAINNFPIHHEKTIYGTFATGKLRHMKNLFIATLTMAGHSASRGGLSPNIVSQLFEIYIADLKK